MQIFRRKATASYWTQPRRSSRLRKREASHTKQTPMPTNPQSTSPLFTIPPEIRDHIFKLALTAYENSSKPCNAEIQVPRCDQRSFPHHRPGHYHHLRTDTALLRTCRLIYEETALLLVSVNTHTLYYPDFTEHPFLISTIAFSYFKRMTPAQLAAVQHLHIFANRSGVTAEDPDQDLSFSAFADLVCLRGRKEKRAGELKDTCGIGGPGIGGPYPKTMTITIRYCDWQFQNPTHSDLCNMLGNRHWGNVLGGLKDLRIEIEIEDKEKDKLIPVINSLREFEFDIGGGVSLVAEENVKESLWVGPIVRHFVHSPYYKWEETKYHVVTIFWKMRPVGQGSAN